MEIQQSPREAHAIQTYTDHDITVAGIVYCTSTLITPSLIITDWSVRSIHDVQLMSLQDILPEQPEVIIMGHAERHMPHPALIAALHAKRIGIECMAIGAACRTFNILLGESRRVILGFIPNAVPPAH